MVLERDVERRLVRRVESTGGLCIKLLPDAKRGLPDRLCVLPGGRIVWVELKAPGETPRRTQRYIHSVLRRLGHRVEVCSSVAEVEALEL